MKSKLGYLRSLMLASIAATLVPRVSYGQEAPNAEGGSAVATPPSVPSAGLPAPGARKWYDAVKLEGFVDGYASINAHSPKPQTGQNLGRPFDVTNGFALHWVGLNASYAPDPVGATVGLRFGPGTLLYNSAADLGAGLTFVKQAFASWKPVNGVPLQIDFGKFDTWIGAEVADSQGNMTYTRTALFMTQPYYHTGVRVDIAASEQLDFKLFAVNGVNSSIDNNAMKTFGGAVSILPVKELALYLNYVGGPEQNDLAPPAMMGGAPTVVPGANGRWRHLGDVVADVKVGRARVLVNGDLGTEKLAAGTLAMGDPEKSVIWFGGNLTFGYAVSDVFAFALRGEYLGDPDGYLAPVWGAPAGGKTTIADGTLTLSVTPTPNLIVKLEPRVDAVSSDAPGFEGNFPKSPDAAPPGFSKLLFTTTLGVVATTN